MFCTIYLKSSWLDDVERRVASESPVDDPLELDGFEVMVGDAV